MKLTQLGVSAVEKSGSMLRRDSKVAQVRNTNLLFSALN